MIHERRHRWVEFWFPLGVCNSRNQKPRGRKRLRSTNMSHSTCHGSCFRRGVVNMFLVCVEVQGVDSNPFLPQIWTVVYTCTRGNFAHTKQISDYVCHCLLMARIVFLKSKGLGVTKQWHAKVEVLGPCSTVCEVLSTFTHFIKPNNDFEQSEPIDVYNHL